MLGFWPQSLPTVYPAVLPMLESIGFVEIVEQRIGKLWDNGVSHADVLTVLLLLILDQGRMWPIADVDDWAEQFGIEMLLGIDPAQLHDDKIGYTLDALVPVDAAGEPDLSVITQMEHELAHEAISRWGIPVEMLHYDFTDVSLSGVFDGSDLARKGRGPGRRQFELGLNVTAEGFPILSTAHPGATSHMLTAPDNLKALIERLPGQSFCVITDAGAMCYDNAQAYEEAGQHFIAPRQLRPHEKQALADIEPQAFAPAQYRAPGGGRFWLHEQIETLSPSTKEGSVTLRSIAVVSETKRRDTQRQARRQMRTLLERLLEIAGYAGGRGNYRNPEYVQKMADKALAKARGAAQFVTVTVSDEPALEWAIDWAGFFDYRRRLGRYRLYTNLPADQYSADEVLELYRGRHVVEHSYRQLKSQLQIAPIHLHNDNRLYAVVWLYVVALMVLSLLQLLARRAGLTTPRDYPLTARALLKELKAVDALAARQGGKLCATVAPLQQRAQYYLDTLGFPDPQHWLAVPPCDPPDISGK